MHATVHYSRWMEQKGRHIIYANKNEKEPDFPERKHDVTLRQEDVKTEIHNKKNDTNAPTVSLEANVNMCY